MNVNDFLGQVATTYDRHAGLSTPAQRLLRNAGQDLGGHVPAGIRVMGSGGKGAPTFTPWVGFFDPDETDSPERGVYVVYLFANDLSSVTLSLMQGITRLSDQIGWTEARSRLASDAAAIRDGMRRESLAGLSPSMNLGGGGRRQLAYAAGNIASLRYEIGALPGEAVLRADLDRFLSLYQEAVGVKRSLLQSSPGKVVSASSLQTVGSGEDPLAFFKPKDENDYLARMTSRLLIKSRRHERLVRQYGEWVSSNGFAPSTMEHPKDLVLRRDDQEWLVEAKVLYVGNATEAVRAAVGQLYSYRHLLYLHRNLAPPTGMLALFSEPIGDLYVEFLESCGIACVWKAEGKWKGSPLAAGAMLCD